MRGIARWDGESWHPLQTGFNEVVRALAVYNGQLIAGGSFSRAGETRVNNIASWDDAGWQPLGTGTNLFVNALTVHDGRLIAGGTFASAGGVPASHVARWNGTSWAALGAGVGDFPSYFSWVAALCTYRDELIVGGGFVVASGSEADNWARWTVTGIPWIARQPQDQLARRGFTATMHTVPARGYEAFGALTYQWRHNGMLVADGPHGASPGGGSVSGAGSMTLVIEGVGISDAGVYDCTVSTHCGGAQSDSATLGVLCSTDFDADMDVDVNDFLLFLEAMMKGNPQADFNADDRINSQDLFDFLSAFFQGCP